MINMKDNAFTPNNLVAYKGQIISISFKATDKTYDISVNKLGLYILVPTNTTKSMDFQATTAGEFTFECKENCPDAPNAKGTLVIK